MSLKILLPLLLCFLFLEDPVVPRGSNFPMNPSMEETQRASILAFEVLTPIGDIIWMPGDPLLFKWDSLDNYTGAYRLKILEQELGDPLPAELPDTGLFFEETDISDTKFGYPVGAPDFLESKQYAWQVETVDMVNGVINKSINIGIFNTTYVSIEAGCEISVSTIPSTPLCPGECFNLVVNFPNLVGLIFNNLIVYSDAEDLSTISVGPALPPYPLAELSSAPVESPSHYEGIGLITSTVLQICMDAGSDQPVNFSIYYYRNLLSCSSDPLGASCCHDVVSFEMEVLDIPDFTNLEMAIKDPTVTNLLDEICSGDPANFSILNLPGTDGVNLEWQYNDQDENGWQPITGAPFNLFTFAVLEDNDALTIDCASSTTGYVDRIFRAKLTYEEDESICEYFTTEYPLRICCPITTATLNINTEDLFDLNVGLCEGDELTLDIEFTPDDLFLDPPGEFVSIEWDINGFSIPYDNQTNFSLTETADTEDICISATVSNCAGKERVFTQCINVDPKPICGTIDVITPGTNMIAPGMYEICPNTALTLEATGFDDCIIHWEYSYDEVEWIPMGTSSNTIQNTNLLIEGGNEVICYRVQCKPFSDPSGCDPCFSNTIKILENQDIPVDQVINCSPTLWCSGTMLFLGVEVTEPGVNYTWYVNGLPFSEGPNTSFILDEDKCFYYTAETECYSVTSNVCCLEACVITAVISCPLAPNECACLGEPIWLNALSCTSSCPESELTYVWNWVDQDGVPQTSISSEIQDIPSIEGTTYTLTVTDELLGCSDTTTRTVIPCECGE